MNLLRALVDRREFLKISSLSLASPWIMNMIPDASYAATSAKPDKSIYKELYIGDEEWLKLTTEQVLEPDMPICDPHHHLWPGYLPEEFLLDMNKGHNIVKTVFVESVRNKQLGPIKMQPVEETEFIVAETAKVKSRTKFAAGIVGSADLMLGDGVIPLLENHIKAGDGRFRGIRLGLASAISDKKFREGYANLRKFNLSADIFIAYNKFNELVNLAQTFPGIPIIVNHIGDPTGIGTHDEASKKITEEWKIDIKALATCRNVYMKLGGLGMSGFGFGWNTRPAPPGSLELAKEMEPYLSYCIDQFGTGRCMFESNWPVDKESYSYNILWNAFKKMTKGFSTSERSALFYDTAAKAYRI
jgi:L-fuconolactonase